MPLTNHAAQLELTRDARPAKAPLSRGLAEGRGVSIRLGFAILALILAPLRAEIEFNGILATKERMLFALLDTSSGKSEWHEKGEAFSGFSIGDFDAQDDSLALTRAGTTTRVRLKDAKVRPARLEISGTFTIGEGQKLEVRRASLPFDQETEFPLKDGLLCRVTVKQRPDGTLRYDMIFERKLSDNKTERIAAPSIIALPGHDFKLQLGDLGFAFTPRTL